MVIFGDYSTYNKTFKYSFNSKSNKKVEMKPMIELITKKKPQHVGNSFEYSFSPENIEETISSDDDTSQQIKDQLEDYIKDKAWELSKDAIGASLVGIGSWLAVPDPVLGPIDEIVGVGLIWVGRFIMWV